jgi:hypothetical protein
VSSGALIEIKADHRVWKDLRSGHDPLGLFTEYHVKAIRGSIVKLTPPAGLAESHVSMLQTVLHSHGVRAIRRMPSPPDDKVIIASNNSARHRDARTLRQVVTDRAKHSSSADVDALVMLLNEAMDEGEK